jgi:hypothetical protein
MTTTELIKLLQQVEKGASGRSREISIFLHEKMTFLDRPDISIYGTGDGCAGAELRLLIRETPITEEKL